MSLGADIWGALLASWPYSERMLVTVGLWIAISGTFLSMNALLHLCHVTNSCKRYKIQGQNYPDWELVRDCLIQVVVVTHLIVRPITIWFGYPIFIKCGMQTSVESLPSVSKAIAQIVASMLITNALFYWAHRLLHHRRIYKYIHKQHHKFITTIGIAAEYAHPVEAIVANALPTVAGPLLLGMHMSVFWIFMAIRTFETVDAHSGYQFPWSPFAWTDWTGGADRHDFHHSHNKGNYGGAFFHIWDRLMGTDADYVAWKAEQEAEKQN